MNPRTLLLQFAIEALSTLVTPEHWICSVHRSLANRYPEDTGWPLGTTGLWDARTVLGGTEYHAPAEFLNGSEQLLMLAENFSVGLKVGAADSDDPMIMLSLIHRLDILDGGVHTVPAVGTVVLTSTDGKSISLELVDGDSVIPVSGLKSLYESAMSRSIMFRIYTEQPVIPAQTTG